jgi:predicted TIM-barrel fold metal-dependent hydrolase
MQGVPDLRLGVLASGNSNSGMLIDVHAHFYHAASPRADWRERNASRLAAGRRIGVTIHVASILGSWGRTSPTYFPSPRDVEEGNTALLALQRDHPDLIRAYVTVNPNYTSHACAEIARCLGAGMVGIKLAASRRATDPLLDPICELAVERGVPVLHHVWQHRRHDWPGQEASDGQELAALAARHPQARFILAHIGGGGDWEHSLAALRATPNVYVDLSGSGVDGGMLEACLEAAGVERLLWGSDLTMDTGWAKLRYLERLLPPPELELVQWRNAARIFPRGAFPAD